MERAPEREDKHWEPLPEEGIQQFIQSSSWLDNIKLLIVKQGDWVHVLMV